MEKEKRDARLSGAMDKHTGKTGCCVVLLCGCQICQVTAKWGGLTALEQPYYPEYSSDFSLQLQTMKIIDESGE